jgi:hypothetical protein
MEDIGGWGVMRDGSEGRRVAGEMVEPFKAISNERYLSQRLLENE